MYFIAEKSSFNASIHIYAWIENNYLQLDGMMRKILIGILLLFELVLIMFLWMGWDRGLEFATLGLSTIIAVVLFLQYRGNAKYQSGKIMIESAVPLIRKHDKFATMLKKESDTNFKDISDNDLENMLDDYEIILQLVHCDSIDPDHFHNSCSATMNRINENIRLHSLIYKYKDETYQNIKSYLNGKNNKNKRQIKK